VDAESGLDGRQTDRQTERQTDHFSIGRSSMEQNRNAPRVSCSFVSVKMSSTAVRCISKYRLFLTVPTVKWEVARHLATSGAKRKLKKEGILKKRGASALNVSHAQEATDTNQVAKKQGTPPPAVLILVIFPLLATGILVAFRPDLQEEMKQNWSQVQSSEKGDTSAVRNES
jgi:hypothetical protein